ncbi:hypothetical protein H4S07_000333 [Coemansia furcata]|uniref:Uncharacterized protein n=1 Tax=Coemansia furcata TaxID=417177 RepID=A0ACC1LSI8_9FUNG|nr:hypothetical protein H4S07_000333 [Coemansia furcata]
MAHMQTTGMDARITRFKVEFPVKAEGGAGLEPTQTYYGRVVMHTSEAVGLRQVHLQLEGLERVDVGGAKPGSSQRELFRATAELLPGVRTVSGRAVFEFACTMPNVNFPAAMRSAICEIAYTASAWVESAGRGRRLASDSVPVQVAPRVVPSGVGWLKPLVLRDGIEVPGVRRRLRRSVAAPAMSICVRVRNHCCTLGEAIALDVDTTMLQRDRVLASVRAAVVEQVTLKSREGGPPTVLAERTLNRKAVEASAEGPCLTGVHDMHIRVPRRDVCTADGAALSFAHVLRLTFELASLTTSADSHVATKDVPLRLVTSKFGDVGRASQVEINRRLSALTAESDGGVVSEAYGYLLGETGRASRPMSLDTLLATAAGSVPQPCIVALGRPTERPSPPLSVRSTAQDSCVVPPTPAPPAFQFGPLPPLPQPSSSCHPTPSAALSPTNTASDRSKDSDDDEDDGAFCFAPQITRCGAGVRDTLVDNALGVSLPDNAKLATSLPPLPPTQLGHTLTTKTAAIPIKSPSPVKLQPSHSDKRESSQSESETIVFSPRSDQCDSDASDDCHIALEHPAPSTRSVTPELKAPVALLPTLPTIQSLDDMTKDMLGCSAVFDSMEFSSYWTNTGFC